MIARLAVGCALLAAGTFLRFRARKALAKVGIDRFRLAYAVEPSEWLTTGVYRLKHPLYLGHAITIAGVGVLALGLPGFVLALPAVPYFQHRAVSENALRARTEGARAGIIQRVRKGAA